MTRGHALGGLMAIAVMALATVGTGGAVAADSTFEPGSGQAVGIVAQVGGIGANLRFVVGYGQSVATYQGTVGQSRSQMMDLGVAGLFVTTPICPGTPPPVDKHSLPPDATARTGEPGAAEGHSLSPVALQTTPVRAAAGQEQAWATSDPGSRSVTTLSAFGVPGVVEVEGGRSEARTSVLARQGRVATATSQIDVVDLLDGRVRLEGLRWDAAQRTDAAGRVVDSTQSFSVQRALINGRQVVTDPATPPVDAINAALAPTGFAVEVPRSRAVDGDVSVSTLGLRMMDSRLAHQTIAPLFGAAEPVRGSLGSEARQQSCSLALALEGADVGLSALAGTGGGLLELGGVSATTEGHRYATPFAAVAPGSPIVSARIAPPAVVPGVAASSSPANAPMPGTSGRPGTVLRRVRARYANGSHTIAGAAGGIAALAAVGAIVALVVLAAADGRHIAIAKEDRDGTS